MGVGRAPPGTVAQQRFTEHGVAAPAPMVHEDGAVWTHDDAMRVRLPPVRAALPTCDGAKAPRHFLACAAFLRCGPTREGYLVLLGFESRLVPVTTLTRAGRRSSVIPFTETLAWKPGASCINSSARKSGGGLWVMGGG
jgi:hypothetical protein